MRPHIAGHAGSPSVRLSVPYGSSRGKQKRRTKTNNYMNVS